MTGRTISQIYSDTIERHAQRVAIGGRTWAEVDHQRLIIAAGLMHLVLHPKRRVLTALRSGEEHALAHLGVWSAGAVPVVVDWTRAPHEIAELARDSEATHAIVENASIARVVARDSNVRSIVVRSGDAPPEARAIAWSELLRLGTERLTHNDKDAYERFRSAQPDTIAAIAGGVAIDHEKLIDAALRGREMIADAPLLRALIGLVSSILGGEPLALSA